jgi:type IV secretion system protein VirB11
MSYLATYLRRLDPVIQDPGVIEIAVNAGGDIWIERAGSVHMSPAPLPPFTREEVRNLAAQIANSTSNTFTDTSPIVSAAIDHGGIMLRAQVIGAPASAGGTILTMRVFRQAEAARASRKFTFLRQQGASLEDERRALVASLQQKSSSQDVDAFLKLLIDHRMNVIISGGTSTGKTELGRRMLNLVAAEERIVTIEDSLELLPSQKNVVSLISSRDDASERSANLLLQATLRLRPDRIILGELRGIEAATFLDAINTGHAGSFTTIHAQTARKAMDRLALLVMANGSRLSFADVIRYLETCIDVIIQMGREGDRRGIMEVWFPGLG